MRTRGFTLIELMVVIVVVAIILTYGFPKVRILLIKSNLRAARTAVATAVQQAKTHAVTDGRMTTVKLDPVTGTMWVAASPRRTGPGTEDTIGAVKYLGTSYGAAVTAAQTTFAFDQRGLLSPIGSSMQKIALSRSGYRDSVTISGYGRITR